MARSSGRDWETVNAVERSLVSPFHYEESHIGRRKSSTFVGI